VVPAPPSSSRRPSSLCAAWAGPPAPGSVARAGGAARWTARAGRCA